MVCGESLLGKPAEPDHSLAADLQAVATHEGLLAVRALHECAVGALVDQHELVAIDLDARMQARDQIALHHHVVVLGTSDGDARVPLVDQQLAVVAAQPQAHAARRPRLDGDARHHAGDVLGLPQHLVQGDLAALALEGGNVDLAARKHAIPATACRPSRRWSRSVRPSPGWSCDWRCARRRRTRRGSPASPVRNGSRCGWRPAGRRPSAAGAWRSAAASAPRRSSAASAVGKVAITSSPMVLITVPWRCSVALRITSMQIDTISRARTSPMRSYSRVEPTTSANRMASSMSLPMLSADYT